MSWNISNRLNNLQNEVSQITQGSVYNPLQSDLNMNNYKLTDVSIIDGGANEITFSTANSNGINLNGTNLTTTGNINCDTLNYTTLNPPVDLSHATLETILQNNNDGEQLGIINLKYLNLGTTPSTYTTNTIDLSSGQLINANNVETDYLNCQEGQFTNVNVAQNLEVGNYLTIDNTITGASQIHLKCDNVGSNFQLVGDNNQYLIQQYKGNQLYNQPFTINDNQSITFKTDGLYISNLDGSQTGQIYDTVFNPPANDATKTSNYFALTNLSDSVSFNTFKAYLFDGVMFPHTTKPPPQTPSYSGVYGLWSKSFQTTNGAREATLKCDITFTINNSLGDTQVYDDNYALFLVPSGSNNNPLITSHTQAMSVYGAPFIFNVNDCSYIGSTGQDGFYNGGTYTISNVNLNSVNYDQSQTVSSYNLIVCQMNIYSFTSKYQWVINAIDGVITYDNLAVNKQNNNPQ